MTRVEAAAGEETDRAVAVSVMGWFSTSPGVGVPPAYPRPSSLPGYSTSDAEAENVAATLERDWVVGQERTPDGVCVTLTPAAGRGRPIRTSAPTYALAICRAALRADRHRRMQRRLWVALGLPAVAALAFGVRTLALAVWPTIQAHLPLVVLAIALAWAAVALLERRQRRRPTPTR